MEFKKFTQEIQVNGINVPVTVTIEVQEDDPAFLLDCDFPNEEEKRRYEEKLERSSIFAGCILVTAEAEGLKGFDSLGACELKPNNMFNSTPFNRSVNSYLKEYGLVAQAVEHLKTQLEQEYSRLSTKAEQYKKFAGGAK